MGIENPYRLPWDIEYRKKWKSFGEESEELERPLVVMRIFDCDNNTVIETDCGIYQPDVEQAQFIIKCVNSSGEG